MKIELTQDQSELLATASRQLGGTIARDGGQYNQWRSIAEDVRRFGLICIQIGYEQAMQHRHDPTRLKGE